MARSPRRTWNSSKKRNKNGSFWDTSSDKKKTNKQKRGCVRVCGVLPRLLGRTLFFGGAAQTPLTREEKILNVNRRCPSEGSVYSIWTVKWRFKFARFAKSRQIRTWKSAAERFSAVFKTQGCFFQYRFFRTWEKKGVIFDALILSTLISVSPSNTNTENPRPLVSRTLFQTLCFSSSLSFSVYKRVVLTLTVGPQLVFFDYTSAGGFTPVCSVFFCWFSRIFFPTNPYLKISGREIFCSVQNSRLFFPV